MQCMLHWRAGVNPNRLIKGIGTWTAEEDDRLRKLVKAVGTRWADVARHIPGRVAKQCRERYLNHLDPSLRKEEPWTMEEEAVLMQLCHQKQHQWAEICRHLNGRGYNDVKNRYNLIQRRIKRERGHRGSASVSACPDPTAVTGGGTDAAPTLLEGTSAPLAKGSSPSKMDNPNRGDAGGVSCSGSGVGIDITSGVSVDVAGTSRVVGARGPGGGVREDATSSVLGMEDGKVVKLEQRNILEGGGIGGGSGCGLEITRNRHWRQNSGNSINRKTTRYGGGTNGQLVEGSILPPGGMLIGQAEAERRVGSRGRVREGDRVDRRFVFDAESVGGQEAGSEVVDIGGISFGDGGSGVSLSGDPGGFV
ncbi:unnamed protein product [Choristocarpus tenellus]